MSPCCFELLWCDHGLTKWHNINVPVDNLTFKDMLHQSNLTAVMLAWLWVGHDQKGPFERVVLMYDMGKGVLVTHRIRLWVKNSLSSIAFNQRHGTRKAEGEIAI